MADALSAPLNTLESNWAYMVMTALAWNLKAWSALCLPDKWTLAEKAPSREVVAARVGVQGIR